MKASPQQIQPLGDALMDRIDSLVGDLSVQPGEDLGDVPLL